MNHLLAVLLVSLSAASALAQDNSQSAPALKLAARKGFAAADPNKAREHLRALHDLYGAEHANNPSWRGEYQWSRRLAEVAHEYLRAGQFDDALAIGGEAADLDVPLRNGFDNGLASIAGGLNRHLAARDSDERYELLHEWSMPTESRRTVRVLESFVPMTGPPPAFARVFGERPRDSSFPIARVGEVSGLFSTAWELVRAADEAGRLRQLTAELEGLAEQKVANAKHVFTLAKIVGAKNLDEELKTDLTQSLNMLRDNTPRPTEKTAVASFGDAWQYGYGTYDFAKQRTVEFSPFAVWSGAAWQMIAVRPHANADINWLRVDRTGGHPTDFQHCIRRWVAPADGVLSLTGTMHHPAPQGDGVHGRVVSNRLGLRGEWLAHNGSSETTIDALEVKAGDTIDFAIDHVSNGYFDTFVWMFQLRLKTSEGVRIYDSVADFLGPSDAHLLSDAVLAAVCVERPWLQPLGAGIFEKLLENTYDAEGWLNRPHESDSRLIRPVLRRAWATAVGKRFGDGESRLLDDAELGMWVPISGLTSAQHAEAYARQSWLAYEGQLVHLAGSGNDYLFFKYPLTGEFTFSVNAQSGGRPGTDGGVAYGGLAYQINNSGQLFTVSDLEARGEIVRDCPQEPTRDQLGMQYAGQPGFHRITLASNAARITFATNDHIIWSEPANSHASPWLALRSVGDHTPIFRDLKIIGDPIIPRKVPMSEGDRLQGWSSGYYGERMPAPLRDQQTGAPVRGRDDGAAKSWNANFRITDVIAARNLTPDRGADARPGGSAIGTDGATVEHDWFAKDGIIYGTRRECEGTPIAQSRLYYFRPLLDGETISYEFQYAPGQYEVHPALGRLAFLIEPRGVRLHWMTDGEQEWTGLAEDNTVVEPFDRRGPKPLPLVADNWNRMIVALAEHRVTLTLNEQVIYERKLEPGEERTFGFYHDACQSAAQVRNVVLRGDWPERLTSQQHEDLAEVSLANRSDAHRRVLSHLFEDRYLAPRSLDIARRAKSLPAAQRFDYLAGWVLPGIDVSTIRMLGTFAPLPAPPLGDEPMLGAPSPSAFPAVETRRVPIGAQLIAPAMDFVTLAKQLGRLDEVRNRLAAADSEAADIAADNRADSQRHAFLALVNIADEDFAAAKANLGALVEGLERGDVTETLDRWPETVALWVALRHPATEEAARELLDVINELVRTGKLGETEAWKRHITALAFEANFRREIKAFGQATIEQPLTQWHAASHVTASSRGQGFSSARWQRLPHRIDNVSGHDCDYLYFQSPLQGDFEVECDVASTFGWRETSLTYGGLWMLPWGDMAHYGISTLRDRRHAGTLFPAPKFTDPGPWMRYRIAVRGNRMQVYFNGLLIREQPLSSVQDPWLAIRNQWQRSGAVRDLRITGQPVIPSELNLIAPGLQSWLPYADDPAGLNTQWQQFAVGEFVGQRNASPSATGRESLLQYHRPMCEDGTIEYEFYYEPGRSQVSPALDRLALLLEPAGVRVHWITDGIHDRTGLDPVNASDEPQNRRGPARLPLVAGEWNKLRLTLTGDTVSITLNDQLVYERELDPTNARTFGLFHDANQTEARVRNIVWRGDWPRELPPLSQQELADASTIEWLQEKLPELTETIEIDFARQGLPRELLSVRSPEPSNLARDVTAQPDGVHVTSKAPAEGNQYYYLGSLFRVGGDFDLTASFDGFETKVVSPDGTASLVWLTARFEDAGNDHVALLRKHEGNGQHRLHVYHHWGPPDQRRQKDDGGVYDGRAGVLRMSRRGGKLYCLLAESEAGPFRVIEQRDVSVGDVPLDGIQLLLEARTQAVATIVWKKLSIRAERITEKQLDLFAKLTPDEGAGQARYVRVDLPNKTEILTLAEVEVISGGKNVARGKPATQSSVLYDGVAGRAVDGNRNGHFGLGLSTTHTASDLEPWWEVDLGRTYRIEEVQLWNRTEAGQDRLRGVRVQLLDEQRKPVWQQTTDAASTGENGKQQ